MTIHTDHSNKYFASAEFGPPICFVFPFVANKEVRNYLCWADTPTHRTIMPATTFAPGFITGFEDGYDDARLIGVSCGECDIVLFGDRDYCENCGSSRLSRLELETTGEIYSYTVQRAPPVSPFAMGTTDRDEWEPRPIGYVDLPEGVRLLSVLEGPIELIDVGTKVSLRIEPGWEDGDGTDVLCYKFAVDEQ